VLVRIENEEEREDQSSRGPIHMSHNNYHSRTRYYKKCHVQWSYMPANCLVGIAFLCHSMENYIPQQSADILLKIPLEVRVEKARIEY